MNRWIRHYIELGVPFFSWRFHQRRDNSFSRLFCFNLSKNVTGIKEFRVNVGWIQITLTDQEYFSWFLSRSFRFQHPHFTEKLRHHPLEWFIITASKDFCDKPTTFLQKFSRKGKWLQTKSSWNNRKYNRNLPWLYSSMDQAVPTLGAPSFKTTSALLFIKATFKSYLNEKARNLPYLTAFLSRDICHYGFTIWNGSDRHQINAHNQTINWHLLRSDLHPTTWRGT